MQKIIDLVKKRGTLYDCDWTLVDHIEDVTYMDFQDYFDKIWDSVLYQTWFQKLLRWFYGPWALAKNFRDENPVFETYNIPFIHNEEKFYLVLMTGQGYSKMIMTEQDLIERQKRLKDNNYYRS